MGRNLKNRTLSKRQQKKKSSLKCTKSLSERLDEDRGPQCRLHLNWHDRPLPVIVLLAKDLWRDTDVPAGQIVQVRESKLRSAHLMGDHNVLHGTSKSFNYVSTLRRGKWWERKWCSCRCCLPKHLSVNWNTDCTWRKSEEQAICLYKLWRNSSALS